MPLFKIDNNIEDLFQQAAESLLNPIHGLARKVTLIFKETQSKSCPNCWVSGTQVYTNKGFRNIEDIIVGNYILTSSGYYKKVTKIYSRLYNGKFCKFTFYGCSDPLICTDDHRILTDSGFIHAHNSLDKWIVRGFDRQLLERENLKFVEIEYSKYKKCKIHNDLPRVIEINDDFLKIIGWYIAEGCINKQREINYCLCSDEKEYADQINDSFKRIFNHSATYTYRKDAKNLVLSFYNSTLSRWLLDWCGHLAHNKKIPQVLFEQLSIEQLLKLIHYYLLGDGSSCRKYKTVTSVSKKLIYQIFMVWQTAGLAPFLSFKKAYIDKKRQRHKDSWTVGHNSGKYNVGKIKPGLSFSHDYAKVNKMEIFEDSRTVYNIEIENEHDYIVSGIIVANCTSNPILRTSSRTYDSTNPNTLNGPLNKSFTVGACPVCNNKGFIEDSVPKQILVNMLCLPNVPGSEDEFVETGGLNELKTTYYAVGYITDKNNIERCDHAIMRGDKVRRVGPVSPLGLKSDKYLESYWEKF